MSATAQMLFIHWFINHQVCWGFIYLSINLIHNHTIPPGLGFPPLGSGGSLSREGLVSSHFLRDTPHPHPFQVCSPMVQNREQGPYWYGIGGLLGNGFRFIWVKLLNLGANMYIFFSVYLV